MELLKEVNEFNKYRIRDIIRNSMDILIHTPKEEDLIILYNKLIELGYIISDHMLHIYSSYKEETCIRFYKYTSQSSVANELGMSYADKPWYIENEKQMKIINMGDIVWKY
jgi:hypothetical protein